MRQTIFLAAGGSIGHISPALATAQALKQINPDYCIIFITDKRKGKEILPLCQTWLEGKGYAVEMLNSIGLPSGFSLKYIIFMLKLYRDFISSLILIKKYKPSLVAGFGGYLSFPVVMAAWFSGVRSIIHEQNVIPGRANRILSWFVSAIALSFSQTELYFKVNHKTKFIRQLSQCFRRSRFSGKRASLPELVVTGNPVREEIEKDTPEYVEFDLTSQDDRFTILVMGGSQGAHQINKVFLQTLVRLNSQIQSRLQIIHLTGAKDFEQIKSAYLSLKVRAYIYPFLKQMGRAYQVSDLVICRAGASCLSELSYYGCAAILVPYPYAYSHQVENARYFAQRQAALMLEQAKLTPERLGGWIVDLMNNSDKRRLLSVNIKKLSCPDAARRLAREIVKWS